MSPPGASSCGVPAPDDFDALVAEAATVPIDGWDFSSFEEIRRDGELIAYARRFLIEARKGA